MTDVRKPDFGLNFRSAAEREASEASERRKLVARRLRYNCKFLDDAIGSLLPHDLVLLGARTGVGKTALASMIAETSAAAGKRVHYFALEAEPAEIERRIKFRLIALHLRGTALSARLSYRDWYEGHLDQYIEPAVYEAISGAFRQKLSTLFTYYRGLTFKLEDLERLVLALEGQTDLVVLDHFHYVDTDDAQNENAAQKRIAARLRDMALALGIPVIVVAHLRKKDLRRAALVPDIDEFMGSSDLAKQATHAILVAPAIDAPSPHPWLANTYVAVRKDRRDGAKPYVAQLVFNRRMERYEADYTLGRLNFAGDEWEPVPEKELPRWAQSATRARSESQPRPHPTEVDR